MKHAPKLLLIASILHLQSAIAQRITLTLPETKNPVFLRFEPMPRDKRNFNSIYIDADGKNFHFVPKTPIARIPDNQGEKLQRGLRDEVAGLELHRSRYFFQGTYGAESNPHTLLFFVTEPGIGASPLFVIGFSDNGTPYKVLEQNALDLYSFQSSRDGDALIIGKAAMSEVMAGDGSNGSKTPYATTYDPFSVFIVHGLSQAQYSLDASMKYNRAHYVWAGPHSREDYAVLFNLPGHPKIMGSPASKVEALLGSNGNSTVQ